MSTHLYSTRLETELVKPLLDKDKDDKEEVKTTVRLRKGMLKRLKLHAVERNISMSDIIVKLIADYLNKEDGKK